MVKSLKNKLRTCVYLQVLCIAKTNTIKNKLKRIVVFNIKLRLWKTPLLFILAIFHYKDPKNNLKNISGSL